MNIDEVKENIKKGLKKGYKQNLLLLSSYNNFRDKVQEYLLTVNVAQQLLEWNSQHIYKVQIEYPVFHFYNNAFPAYKLDFKSLFHMALIHRQLGHSPTDKLQQKIDIAITQEQNGDNASTHERTLAGIELKGINKSEESIIDDAKRMAQAMLLKDKISPNSIEFCFCGFLKRFDNSEDVVTKNFIHKSKLEAENNWNKICNNLTTEYSSLEFSIESFEILNTSLEEIAEIHKSMDSDSSEVAQNTGTVVGFILSITRKQ